MNEADKTNTAHIPVCDSVSVVAVTPSATSTTLLIEWAETLLITFLSRAEQSNPFSQITRDDDDWLENRKRYIWQKGPWTTKQMPSISLFMDQ